MPADHRISQGQTAIEYLLLLAVVAVVVISSFKSGSLIDQVHNSAKDYYKTVTKAIMNSDDNPQAIQGDWCPVTCPTAGGSPNVLYGACECPPPAFGGTCPNIGTAVSCGAGQTCKGFKINCS